MLNFILRILYIIWGKLILYPVIVYSIKKELTELPKFFFYYDNKEDGYTGNKRGWYDGYLNITASELSVFKQSWYAYRWSAWRNPCWNLRFHPWISIIINDDTHMDILGNTVSHDWKAGKQWYDVLIDNKYKSHFRLHPLTKKKSLYLRWGWKSYPEFYGKKIPLYKQRSIWAITLRIRGDQS